MGKVISAAIILLSTIGIVAWYYVQHEPPKDSSTVIPTKGVTQTEPVDNPGGIKLTPMAEVTSAPTPTRSVTVSNVQIIDSQPVQLYFPVSITSNTPLIVYSHGSNEHVTEDEPTPAFFAEAIKTYGDYFVEKGAIFVASEMYGENWGSSESVDHLNTVIETIRSRNNLTSATYLYGFSMGGLPTLRFAKAYPEQTTKVALLAPTINMPDWDQSSIEQIKSIPIHIWHGSKDVNVPPSLSAEFFQTAQTYGHENIEREVVQDEVHRHFLAPAKIWTFFTE